MKETGVKSTSINRNKIVFLKAILSLVKVETSENRIFIAYYFYVYFAKEQVITFATQRKIEIKQSISSLFYRGTLI